MVGAGDETARSAAVAEAMADPAIRADVGQRLADEVIAELPTVLTAGDVARTAVLAVVSSPMADPVVEQLVEREVAARLGEVPAPVEVRVAELVGAADPTIDPLLLAALELVPPVEVLIEPAPTHQLIELRDTVLPVIVAVAIVTHVIALLVASRARAALAGCVGVGVAGVLTGVTAGVLAVAPTSLTTIAVGQLVPPLAAALAVGVAVILAARAWLAHTGRWSYPVSSFDDGGFDFAVD